jgi:DNA-binding CsgD family transcriptional regulator
LGGPVRGLGLCAVEPAHRLGLSHSTVKHHLANARSRVGAETTAQLVWILAARLPEPDGVAEVGE